MLRKFHDENWQQKLAQADIECQASQCGSNKTIKRWFVGTITVACIRERVYSQTDTITLVCLLRDGNDLYSYDESYFDL